MISTSETLHLKLKILAEGVRISSTVEKCLSDGNNSIASDDYSTTSGVPLNLGQEYFVNAPFREQFVNKNGLVLDGGVEGFFLTDLDASFVHPVTPFRVPSYYSKFTKSGTPLKSVVNTHTDRARISPILGCALDCHFCDAPGRNAYSFHTDDAIAEAVEYAISDEVHPASHFLVSGGTPRKNDEIRLENVYRSVAKRSSIPVDVMMAPRRDLDCLQRMFDFGINDIFVNIEGLEPVLANVIMSSKTKIGEIRYREFLESAVSVFGSGRVMSLIVAGLGSIEATVNSCKSLCELGVIPVISPFRPARFTKLEGVSPPSPETLLRILNECELIASEHGLFIGPPCKACNHNTLNRPEKLTHSRCYAPVAR